MAPRHEDEVVSEGPREELVDDARREADVDLRPAEVLPAWAGNGLPLDEDGAELPGLSVDLRTVETNMVFVSTRATGVRASQIARLFCEAGVLCLDESPWKIRFVTHLDVDDADVAEAGEIVARVMADRA